MSIGDAIKHELDTEEAISDNPLDVEEKVEADAEQHSAISAQVVFEAIRKEGQDELRRPSSALFWSGLAAGLSMGFSLVAEALISHSLPNAAWTPLVSKFGYSLGFLIVILGRQQLFTENTLTPILPLLVQRKLSILLNVLRLWAIVLFANVLGACAFAWAIAGTKVFDSSLQPVFTHISSASLGADFLTIMLRGIFAGWLVALLVWILPFAETGRVIVIIIMTFIIGLGGFAHIIAGSVEMAYLVITGHSSLLTVVTGFWIPTLIGNILGGISLVAALNHAQVVSGGKNAEIRN